MTDKLHIGHRERLRQRLMTYGADALCEHELLELMLFYALPRINTNELAHALINEFGTLNNILNTSVDELTKVKGVGKSAAEFIRLAAVMCENYEANAPEYDKLPDIDSLCRFFLSYFGCGRAVPHRLSQRWTRDNGQGQLHRALPHRGQVGAPPYRVDAPARRLHAHSPRHISP